MDTMTSANKPSEKDGKSAKSHAHASTPAHKALIARNLRMVYDEVAGEPIPDRILDILVQLGEREGKSS